MDIAKLRAELTEDPEGYGYADLPDPEAANALNAPTRPSRGTVAAAEVRRFVLLNGIWPRLTAAQNAPDQFIAGTAQTILQTLAPNSFDEIRMGDPAVAKAVGDMLETMVAAGVMTADQRDKMMALGDVIISRAEELGLERVHHLDVAEARRV